MPSSRPGAQRLETFRRQVHEPRAHSLRLSSRARLSLSVAPLDFHSASGISFLTVLASVKLRIGHADGRAEERELGTGSYRIGREDADIVLPHGSVSARHAVLEVNALGVVIHDVGSRNGTCSPDGQRISGPYRLIPERPVRLGKVTLTLLRAPGQAGGTRAMPQIPPAAGRTRVMAEVPPPLAMPPVERGAPPPPGIGGWLKLLGAALVMLLGFVSLKTCSALLEAVSHEPASKEPAHPSSASKRPANERAPRAR